MRKVFLLTIFQGGFRMLCKINILILDTKKLFLEVPKNGSAAITRSGAGPLQ